MSVYHSKNRKGRYKIDLLRLLENKSRHYCLIKNFPNLLVFLTRSKSKQNKGPKSRFCRNCFQPIVKKNFKKHASFCKNNAPLEIRMPLESTTPEFVSWEKTQKCPFVVYADLEAIKVGTKVYPQPVLGQEKLKDNTQLALGQSLLILEVSGFSNSTSQKSVFILWSKVIECIWTVIFEFLFQRLGSANRASTGEKIVSKNCWIRCVIGFSGVIMKSNCLEV